MKAIINGKIIMPDSIIENKGLVFDQKIIGLDDEPPAVCEVIDAQGLYVAPGLIDVHIHGSKGADTMDANLDAIKTISEDLARTGVTAFLPTTMTMELSHIYQALANVRYWMGQPLKGAKVLGAHVEGPFINAAYKGAQAADHIIPPSYELIADYADVIKLITYAPELDPDHRFAKEMQAKSAATLSIGHSNATLKEMKAALAAGCSHITHLFNGMRPLNHREPGVVGAALTHDVFCEVIADLIHINPELFQFILDNKGAEKIILVSDCIRAGGLAEGVYDLGGQRVTVKDKTVKLASGSLAGSVLRLNEAVKNFYHHTDASLPQVLQMASLNPARSIGISHQKGSLNVGKDADLIFLDADFNCRLTICEGVII